MREDKQAVLVKTAECISCIKFLDCKGRPQGIDACVSFEQNPEMAPWDPQKRKYK